MCFKIFLIIGALLTVSVNSSYFDQSQSGDLNVQVDVKGLHVIALMKGGKEEYVDYDYAYDYSEMTIKPQNRTTPKPLNVVTTAVEPEFDVNKDNATLTGTELELTTLATNESEIAGVALQQIVTHENSTIKNEIGYFNVTETPEMKMNTTTVVTTSTAAINRATPAPICRKGFVVNNKGECELKLQGAGNALLKLVKLSQKLKLRRGNKSSNEDLH